MQGTITVDMIRFCQTVCTAAVAPKCATRVLNDVCPSACVPAVDRSRVPESTSKNEENYNDNTSRVPGNHAKKEEKKMSLGWVANGEDATLGGRGNWSPAAIDFFFMADDDANRVPGNTPKNEKNCHDNNASRVRGNTSKNEKNCHDIASKSNRVPGNNAKKEEENTDDANSKDEEFVQIKSVEDDSLIVILDDKRSKYVLMADIKLIYNHYTAYQVHTSTYHSTGKSMYVFNNTKVNYTCCLYSSQ
jgi:hypothetical protein